MIRNKQFKARVILLSNKNLFIGIAYLFTFFQLIHIACIETFKSYPEFHHRKDLYLIFHNYCLISFWFESKYVPIMPFLYIVINTKLCQGIRLICQCFWRAKNVGLIKQLVCSKLEIFFVVAGEALSYFYYKVLLEGLKKLYRAIYLITAEKQLNVITLAQKIF